jgi:hypothetical protein
MISFIIDGQPLMAPLPTVPSYDSTADAVNQGLIVILRQ